jgi:hypothetical protein
LRAEDVVERDHCCLVARLTVVIVDAASPCSRRRIVAIVVTPPRRCPRWGAVTSVFHWSATSGRSRETVRSRKVAT